MVNIRYIFATFVIVFGSSFQFGFQTGVINAPLELIEEFVQNVTITRKGSVSGTFSESMSSLVVAAFGVGGVFGAVLGGSVSNKMGRKLSLFIFNIPMAVGSLLMMACKAAFTFEMIIVGRLLVGFACGAYTSIAPVYLAEIAPTRIRGASGIMHQLATVSAILISQALGLPEIMGTSDLWPFLLGLSIVPSVFLLLLLWICPDSPRYILLNSQDQERARSALLWFRGDPELIDSEIEEILDEHVQSTTVATTKFAFKDLFRSRALRMALFVSVVAHLAQQFSGINAAISYSTSLFREVGLNDKAAYATIGVGGIIFLVTIISIFLIDRVGRRPLLISGLSVMLVSAILITIGLSLRTRANGLIYMTVAFTYVFVGAFAIGPGSIPWFIVSEMFVQETRDPAVIIAVVVNWCSQIITNMGFPPLLRTLGNYSFLPFVFLLAIFIALLALFLPETRGRTPREVANDFVLRTGGNVPQLSESGSSKSSPSNKLDSVDVESTTQKLGELSG